MNPAAFKSIKVFDHDYAYLDSEAPSGSTDYTTWVTLHGLGFNGAVFEKLLPLAHAHNLRIVSVNRRGYAPSTGFGEDELQGIGFGKKFDEAQPFFRSQGIEIAIFLGKFATEQGIPLANPEHPTGGIVLIGWSLASIHVVTLLAYADELPEDVRATLHKYLHTALTHDAGTTVFGLPNPDRFDLSLLSEPDDRKRFDAFFNWVAAHYTHKSITSGNIDDLEFNQPSDVPYSLHELSCEQRAKYTQIEPFAYTGCDGKLLFCDSTAFAALTKRGLFDKARAEALPKVRVRYMSSGMSPGVFIWPSFTLFKRLEDPGRFFGSDAVKARDIKWINYDEGNHFIFWEDPEKAIEQYSVSINL